MVAVDIAKACFDAVRLGADSKYKQGCQNFLHAQ
jgi:hypothetical protein